MNTYNFMSLKIGQQFKHINYDDKRIYTKISSSRYKDQSGFEDFIMDALTKRWILVEQLH